MCIMQVKATVENGELVIRVPMQKPASSKSGKTLVVATTHGNVTTELRIEGQPVTVGVNAYIRPAKGGAT
jgi:hypothetical protein